MVIRNHNIDIIKMLAILAVIVLHSLPSEALFNTGAPFHIWQAVPIFMLLAGYNAANSYKRRNYHSLKQLYNFSFLYNKLEKLIYPFFIVWLLQVLVQYIQLDGLSIKGLIASILSGGWGPGSYFVPIIIQATLILPLIYLVCKKNLTAMVVILFAMSTGLEFLTLLTEMPESIYRILVIRYLFALTLGVWLSLNKKKINYKWLIPLILISLVYITGVNYFDLIIITEEFWLSQHAPSYFWTLLLIILSLRTYQIKAGNKFSRLSIKIGQASYHIFLVQMFYFWALVGWLPDLSIAFYIFINILVCLIFGLLFFDLDNMVRRLIISRSKNKRLTA